MADDSSEEREEDRKFRWINLPKKCKYKDYGNGKVAVSIPKKTDLWRYTRHGYLKENAPFYFRKVRGDFQVTVKVTADFLDLYDQAGILIRQNRKMYLKCGIEMFQKNRKLCCHASVAVAKDFTDWSTMPLPGIGTKSHWFVVRRLGNCIEAYCSPDGITYNQIRLAQLSDDDKLSVGMYGACPQGSGLKVLFENFDIQESETEEEEEEEEEEEDDDGYYDDENDYDAGSDDDYSSYHDSVGTGDTDEYIVTNNSHHINDRSADIDEEEYYTRYDNTPRDEGFDDQDESSFVSGQSELPGFSTSSGEGPLLFEDSDSDTEFYSSHGGE